MADLTNFNKLSEKQQLASIRAFIKTLPKDKQAQARKDLGV